ncbi:EAL domain-containing protein [Nocardioides sp.]|uniref:sensor domain-containing protein n=1 Tax=Nocardioides sp. TaxID=35761 RepID=UPI003563050F
MPRGLLVWAIEDQDGSIDLVFEWANAVGFQFSGLTEDRVGSRFSDLYPPLYAGGLPEIVADVVRAGAPLKLGKMDYGDEKVAPGTYVVELVPVSDAQVLIVVDRLADADPSDTAALAAVDDAVIRCTPDGVIETWDGSAAQLYGFSEAEALGRALNDVVLPERPEEIANVARLVRAGVNLQRIDSKQRRADGSAVLVTMTFTARRDETGAVIGSTVLVRDRTANARMQESLEHLLQAARVGYWDLGLTAGATTHSSTLDTLLGLPHAQTAWDVQGLLDRVHPGDRDHLRMGISQALEGDGFELGSHEFRVIWPDGSVHWISLRARILRDAAGTAERLVGVAGDVTDRKEAQLRAGRVTHQLTTIVDSLGDAVIGTTPEGIITSWNHAAEQLLGWTEQEVLGQSMTMLIPQDLRGQSERLRKAVAGGEVVKNATTARQRKDGTRVAIEKTISPLWEDDEVVGIIEILRDVTERRRMEQALRHEALHDALTGLPNRVLIRDRLQHALAAGVRSDRPVSVLMLDLDNFKYVNDAAGHAEGDKLLVEVARRLEASLRPGDTIGRFGGDEFVVVCEETRTDDALLVADRLQQALAAPIMLGARRVVVTASIGIAVSPPREAGSLLRSADIAMYHAKSSGRARSSVFGSSMAEHARAHLELSQELRQAIESDGLSLHYQPVVDLATGELLGLEGLVRWHHSARGLVQPVELIGVAEEVGLIEALDRWVLRRACTDGAALMASGLLTPTSRMAVNIGAQHISAGRVVENVAAAVESCAGSGFGFHQLTVEVTETAVMRDLDSARRSLSDLSDLGVSVALDDFGTGYSSLTYLQRLPISVLKIDRSFVDRMSHRAEDVAMATSIVDLASAVGIDSVIAEGIETTEQLGILQEMHCAAGQGWLWSRAVPIEQLDGLMASLPQRRFPVHRDARSA